MAEVSRWWYLDLAAEFPELEIYSGGWGPEQETGLAELGERAMTCEALWLFTWIYSTERDRIRAAVTGMLGMVLDRIRRDRSEADLILMALAGTDPDEVLREEIPDGWYPGVQARDEGRLP